MICSKFLGAKKFMLKYTRRQKFLIFVQKLFESSLFLRKNEASNFHLICNKSVLGLSSTVICMYFRMYVHYDKLHTLERILLPSADGTRAGDILHSQVGHFWVPPDTEAVHVLERWLHAESHRGKHCKSESYQSRKTRPHYNSSDTCIPGSLYRV